MAASEISDMEADASEPTVQSIGPSGTTRRRMDREADGADPTVQFTRPSGTTAEADVSMKRRVAILEKKLITM